MVRPTSTAAFDGEPSWSPDGARIAFTSTRDGDDEIYTRARDGSDVIRLTSDPAFDGQADWQPISSRLRLRCLRLWPTRVATPGSTVYLHPAKLRVSRARVLREDRRVDVLAPITSRARSAEVEVTYQGDDRSDTFEAEVTESTTALDHIRFREPITRGQARLGTGSVNLNYLGNTLTRPEFVRLRAASQRAELDVEEISLLGDLLSAEGSVTSRAEGVVRFRFSYVDPDASPNVHEARAEIEEDGDWALENDQVPAQLARRGGYLSISTGYSDGEQLAYELNAGQTRQP